MTLEGSGAVPRSTQSPHVRGMCHVALVQGQGQINPLHEQIGRPGLGARGCLGEGQPQAGLFRPHPLV